MVRWYHLHQAVAEEGVANKESQIEHHVNHHQVVQDDNVLPSQNCVKDEQ